MTACSLRGEWIDGRPFDGVATHGGYVDVIVHLLGMGPGHRRGAGRAARLRRRRVLGYPPPLHRGRAHPADVVPGGVQSISSVSPEVSPTGAASRSTSASPARCGSNRCPRQRILRLRGIGASRRACCWASRSWPARRCRPCSRRPTASSRTTRCSGRTKTLRDTRAAFDRLVDSRAQFAASETRLIVELPMFRVPLTNPDVAADAPTIDLMAEDYCRKLDANFCVVTDAGGSWIGQTSGARAHNTSRALGVSIATARRDGPRAKSRRSTTGCFSIVSEPRGVRRGGPRHADGRLSPRRRRGARSGARHALRRQFRVRRRPAVRRAVCRQVRGPSWRRCSTPIDRRSGGVDATLRQLGGTSYVGGVFPLRAGRGADLTGHAGAAAGLDADRTRARSHQVGADRAWACSSSPSRLAARSCSATG